MAKKLTKSQRELVRNKLGGRCAYCGEKLGSKFHVDHFHPVYRQGPRNGYWATLEDGQQHYIEGYERGPLFPERDNIENMMPSCASCNILKSTLSIDQFRETIQKFINTLNERSTQYKFAKRYGLVTETGNTVKFYYENFLTNG